MKTKTPEPRPVFARWFSGLDAAMLFAETIMRDPASAAAHIELWPITIGGANAILATVRT